MKYRTNLTDWNQRGALTFDAARHVRTAWVAEIDGGTFSALGRHHADDGEKMTFGELVDRYLTKEVEAYVLPNGKLVRPGQEDDTNESMLPMTATLKRVWAHYRIASMVKATPDESATYLKEIKKEQRTRGYDWASSTWNRYRERAAALFTYAERNQLVPKGSNPFTEARCKDYVEFKQGVPARRIPVCVQEAIYTAIDQRWGASKRFPHEADEMRRRFKFAFATSTRRGEMLRIQREHCDYVRQDGSNAIQLYPDAENGSPRKVIRIDVPVQLTKSGKMTGRAFTRYVAVREAVAILEERMEKFKDRPEAYLFGTEDGRRVKSFPSWTKVFKDVGLKVGRGHGHFRYHDTRHEAISTASVGLSSMQMKNFTGIVSESVLAKYQHADGVATALAAASELERRQVPIGKRNRPRS